MAEQGDASSIAYDDRSTPPVCTYTGAFNAAALHELALDVARHCSRHGHRRILVDITGSRGSWETLARFDVAEKMSSFWPPHLRLAVFMREDQIRDDRFWQVVTRNRGLQTFVSTSHEEARQWLLSDES